MNQTGSDRLRRALDNFRRANILVIGDIIVDHFIWGSVSRISPEAPVPVVRVTEENLMLGGAANVLHNIYAQGGRATLCGVIGNDPMGDQLLQMLTDFGSPTSGIVRSDQRPTTLKTRVVAQHQQVVRFDREQSGPLSRPRLAEVRRFLDQYLHTFDAIIVSDYQKGMISKPLMDHLRKLRQQMPHIPLIVDPKPERPERFRGATIITPNQHEAERMAGISIRTEQDLAKVSQRLWKKVGCEAILITRGEAGMALFEPDQPMHTIPTQAKEVFDVTGAGDTVAAVLALGLAAGLTRPEAALLANHAAGIVVGKLGTATATAAELARTLP